MTGLPIKEGNLQTKMHTERTSSEDESRDRGDASTSQGMSRIATNQQKLRERHGTDFSSHSQKETTLILEFWPPGNMFLLF